MRQTRLAQERFECHDLKSGTWPCAPPPVTTANIEEHMDLVYQVVARVLRRVPSSVLREDLVAAGTYGLLDALRKTGGRRDERFPGYARVRIRGAIMDELRHQDWLTRSARANAASQPPGDGSGPRDVVTSLEDLPPGQREPQSDFVSPFEFAARASQRTVLAGALSRLPDREAQIVHLHYFQGVPFKDIAATMGVSEARVSQLHSRALARMRGPLEDAGEDFAA